MARKVVIGRMGKMANKQGKTIPGIFRISDVIGLDAKYNYTDYAFNIFAKKYFERRRKRIDKKLTADIDRMKRSMAEVSRSMRYETMGIPEVRKVDGKYVIAETNLKVTSKAALIRVYSSQIYGGSYSPIIMATLNRIDRIRVYNDKNKYSKIVRAISSVNKNYGPARRSKTSGSGGGRSSGNDNNTNDFIRFLKERLKEENKSYRDIADLGGPQERTMVRLCTEPEYQPSLDTIILLCLCLTCYPRLKFQLVMLSGYYLRDTKLHRAYMMFIDTSMNVEQAERWLSENRLKPFKRKAS